jgi:hypothetical protein
MKPKGLAGKHLSFQFSTSRDVDSVLQIEHDEFQIIAHVKMAIFGARSFYNRQF